MTMRTPQDRQRRRDLADASVTSLPALAGTLLRHVPSQRRRANLLASLNALAPGPSQSGMER